MLIVLSGLPGTGKSAIADGIAAELGCPVLSVDPVESALIRAGVAATEPTGLAAYAVVQALADEQLRLGLVTLVDAVNAVEAARDAWRSLATAHDVPMRVIECHCSDEDLHRRRLEGRDRGLALTEPSWDDVQRRRLEWVPWPEGSLRLDAVAALGANVREAIAWVAPGPTRGEGAGHPKR